MNATIPTETHNGDSLHPVVSRRRMGRVVHPGMTLEQAYALGYDNGFSKGYSKNSKEYRRVVDMLFEEKQLTAKLAARLKP